MQQQNHKLLTCQDPQTSIIHQQNVTLRSYSPQGGLRPEVAHGEADAEAERNKLPKHLVLYDGFFTG